MDIVFIRHGQGEHLLDYPNQLNRLHPGLTEYGRWQVDELRSRLPIQPDDLLIVSPTRRTIDTVTLLAPTQHFYISPMVGPRMYPQGPDIIQGRSGAALPGCDDPGLRSGLLAGGHQCD